MLPGVFIESGVYEIGIRVFDVRFIYDITFFVFIYGGLAVLFDLQLEILSAAIAVDGFPRGVVFKVFFVDTRIPLFDLRFLIVGKFVVIFIENDVCGVIFDF